MYCMSLHVREECFEAGGDLGEYARGAEGLVEAA